jgi:hypothetical protein
MPCLQYDAEKNNYILTIEDEPQDLVSEEPESIEPAIAEESAFNPFNL